VADPCGIATFFVARILHKIFCFCAAAGVVTNVNFDEFLGPTLWHLVVEETALEKFDI